MLGLEGSRSNRDTSDDLDRRTKPLVQEWILTNEVMLVPPRKNQCDVQSSFQNLVPHFMTNRVGSVGP